MSPGCQAPRGTFSLAQQRGHQAAGAAPGSCLCKSGCAASGHSSYGHRAGAHPPEGPRHADSAVRASRSPAPHSAALRGRRLRAETRGGPSPRAPTWARLDGPGPAAPAGDTQRGSAGTPQLASSGSEAPCSPGPSPRAPPAPPALQEGVPLRCRVPANGGAAALPAAYQSARSQTRTGPARSSLSPAVTPSVAIPHPGASQTPGRSPRCHPAAARPRSHHRLTWASTTPSRRLSVTSSRTAAVPRPAPARRAPRLMLPAPRPAAGGAPPGRGTTDGPGDDPQHGRTPAAARLQGQRSARPAAASEAASRAPPPHSGGPAPSPGPAPERQALWEL